MKAYLEIETTQSEKSFDYWTVRITSRNEQKEITNIIEQDWHKNDYDEYDAANQFLDNVQHELTDLIKR